MTPKTQRRKTEVVAEKQHTINHEVEFSGVGLFLGQPVKIRCLPAGSNTGIVFVRTDMPGNPKIPARLENVAGPQRWTSLRKGDAEVRMVEHVLAACFGLGVDNLLIETNAVEMPVGDGSALTFASAFARAGLAEQDAPRRQKILKKPVAVADKDVVLAAVPQEKDLTITYVLDYGQSFVKSQAVTLAVDRDTFIRDIAPARTYVLRPEVDAFVKLGLGRGATSDNTLILDEDGKIEGKPRFPDECARHKILDILGDLFLAGCIGPARIVGYKSGHAINVQLGRAIIGASA